MQITLVLLIVLVAGSAADRNEPISPLIPRMKIRELFKEELPEHVWLLSKDGAQKLSRHESFVALREGMILVARNGDVAIPETDQPYRFDLPYRFLITEPATGSTRDLRAVAQIEGGGMRFDPREQIYTGSVLIGLEDCQAPKRRDSLGREVIIQLVSDARIVRPDTLSLNHTSIPFERVHIETPSIKEKVRLTIMTEFDNKGVNFFLPVQQIDVMVSPHRIPGLGLATATVIIQAPTAFIGQIRKLNLSTNRGNLETHQVELDNNGAGRTKIRSAGVGDAIIEVVHPDYVAAFGQVEYAWPIGFVASALLGGLVGGTVAKLRDKKSRRPFWKWFVRGIFVGLIVAVAYALGVNVTNIDVGTHSNEAAVFVIAAFGALFGIPNVRRKRNTT